MFEFPVQSLGKQATGMSGIPLNDANIHNVDVSDEFWAILTIFGRSNCADPGPKNGKLAVTSRLVAQDHFREAGNWRTC